MCPLLSVTAVCCPWRGKPWNVLRSRHNLIHGTEVSFSPLFCEKNIGVNCGHLQTHHQSVSVVQAGGDSRMIDKGRRARSRRVKNVSVDDGNTTKTVKIDEQSFKGGSLFLFLLVIKSLPKILIDKSNKFASVRFIT